MKQQNNNSTDAPGEKFVEGEDFYFENDLMILTGSFLLKRGYCCDNGCRHCPFVEREGKNSE